MKAIPLIALVPAAFVLIATAVLPAPARERETITEVFETGEHPRLSLKNINGDLTVTGWDKDTIEVIAVKSANSKENLDALLVNTRLDDDRLRIDVKYEDDDHHHRGEGVQQRVDFTIHVPHGTRINAIELVNGNIEIKDVEGDVDASSVNGEVSGEKLDGHVALATVNGEVSLVANGRADSIRMNSVNGGVLLVLPKKFDARITAGTVHGSIRTMNGFADVDATSFTGSSLEGTLGKGGLKVELNTVNGNIEIRREGESGSKDRE